jgi:type II secretory pathway component PulF
MKTNQKAAAIKQLAILVQTGSTLKEAVDMIAALFPAATAKQEARACLVQYITELDTSIETLN